MFDCWRLTLCRKTGSDDASSEKGSQEAEEEDSDTRVDVPDGIRLVPDPPDGPPPTAGRASCLLGIGWGLRPPGGPASRVWAAAPRGCLQLPGAACTCGPAGPRPVGEMAVRTLAHVPSWQ